MGKNGPGGANGMIGPIDVYFSTIRHIFRIKNLASIASYKKEKRMLIVSPTINVHHLHFAVF